MEAIFLLCVVLSFLFSLFSGFADDPAVLVAMTLAGGGGLCLLLMLLQVALVVVTSALEDKLRVRPKKVADEVVVELLSEIEVIYQIALQRTGYNARRLQEKRLHDCAALVHTIARPSIWARFGS